MRPISRARRLLISSSVQWAPPMIDADAFHKFEVERWEKKAEPYHDFYGPITQRVIDHLLDAAAVSRGTKLLDVATGPGYVAARAAQRAASVVGVDVAQQMIALARRLYPGIEFRHADAEHLPFPAGSFEAVVSNFVVPHLARPEQAVTEFFRVLAPGGKLAITTWDAPQKSRLFGVFLDAVEEVGACPPPDLPPGPPFMRFSSDEEFSNLLRSVGLDAVKVRTISFTHRFANADELWNGTLAGGVRTSALILGQTREVQARIRAVFDRLVRPYSKDRGLEIPAAVKLASGRKPVNA